MNARRLKASLLAAIMSLVLASPLDATPSAGPDPTRHDLEIELDIGRVTGVAAPGAPVTVSVLNVAGETLQAWPAPVGADGRFSVDLVTRGGRYDPDSIATVALAPGTLLGIDLTGSGDPRIIAMPELTVRADVVADTLSGIATAGGTVFAEVYTLRQVLARSPDVRVADGGQFDIPMVDTYDLDPGSFGRLTLVQPNGDAFSTTWLALKAYLETDTGRLWLDAPSNAEVAARLLTAGGVERSLVNWRTRYENDRYQRKVYSGEEFADRFSRLVLPQPGDLVEVSVGDESLRFQVPVLEAAVDLGAEAIRGRTDVQPGSAVRADVVHATFGSARRTGLVDSAGNFALDYALPVEGAAAYDLRYGARVTLRVDAGSVTFRQNVTVPGLTLTMDGARLAGYLDPRSRVLVDWRRDGRTLATLATASDERGAILAELRHPDGRPFDLQPGDELAASPQQGGLAAVLVVPRMTLNLDTATNAIGGELATPLGGELRLSSDRRQGDLPGVADYGQWETKLVWSDSEHFRLDFDEHPISNPFTGAREVFSLVTGAFVIADLRLPDGNRVLLTRQLPMLYAYFGGDRVCGHGSPDSAVALQLSDAGQVKIAEGSTVVQPDGRFDARLRGAGTRLLQAGTHLSGTVGDQAVELSPAPMNLEVDWPASRLLVHGLPHHDYGLAYPDRIFDCWGEVTDEAHGAVDSLAIVTTNATADANGLVDFALPTWFAAGARPEHGLRVDTLTPEFHRVFTSATGLQAELHLGTNRVTGRTTALAAITGRVKSGDGRVMAEGRAVAEGSGAFAMAFEAVGSEPLRIGAGDVIELAVPGESISLVAPLLDFDLSQSRGLLGMAPPDADVQLTFRLMDGRNLETTASTDGSGRYTFTPADIPGSETWDFGDVVSVRSALPLAGRHLAVRDMADAGEPTTPEYKVFLPLALVP